MDSLGLCPPTAAPNSRVLGWVLLLPALLSLLHPNSSRSQQSTVGLQQPSAHSQVRGGETPDFKGPCVEGVTLTLM